MNLYGIYIHTFNKYKDDKLLEKLIKSISEETKARINSYIELDDAIRTMIGRILIRIIIQKKFKIDKKDIHFVINKYGKPILKGYESFHFNISHSYNWVLCAVNDETIGVDIEKIQPINLSIAEKFFSLQEIKWLMSKKMKKLLLFYDLWTLKESYIKAIGKGLYIPLNSFSIIKTNKDKIISSTDYYFKQYDISVDYKLSVCSKTDDFTDKVTIYKIEDVLMYC